MQLLTSGTADGHVWPGAAAVDGGVVVYAAAAEDLPGGDALARQVYERLPAPQGRDVLRSRPPSPPPHPDEAGDAELRRLHAVSDDGSRTVFSTQAEAFGAVVQPELAVLGHRSPQVVLRDADSGETTLVSRSLSGRPAVGSSRFPTIDGAGRRVAFLSSAHDLVPDTPTRGGISHAYVRDLDSGVTTLVDRTALGVPLPGGVVDAVLSGDGRHLVYSAYGAGPPEAPGGNSVHLFAVDLDSGVTRLVDRAPGSGQPGDGDATQPDLSRDGNRVAFISIATNLGAPSDDPQVYVRDLAAGSTAWASTAEDGDSRHTYALDPSISGDGSRVAFTQRDGDFGWGMPPDHGGQVFVRDLAAGTTALVSVVDGERAAFDGISPALDGDGSHVAFLAATSPEGSGARPFQVFLRDRSARATTLLSLAAGGGPARTGARYASVSGDGRCVAFDSGSDDLGGGYGPDYSHAYLRCTGAGAGGGGGEGGGAGGDGGAGGGAGGPGSRGDRVAPRITRARLSRRRFAVAVAGAKRGARAAARRGTGKAVRRPAVPRGTRIAFTLSEAARVSVAVERSLPGRRRGRACVAPRRGLKRRCTRVVTVATPLVRQLRAGKRTLAFSGRSGRRGLRPGAYRLRLVARDRAGNVSRPVRLAFTVVRG